MNLSINFKLDKISFTFSLSLDEGSGWILDTFVLIDGLLIVSFN